MLNPQNYKNATIIVLLLLVGFLFGKTQGLTTAQPDLLTPTPAETAQPTIPQYTLEEMGGPGYVSATPRPTRKPQVNSANTSNAVNNPPTNTPVPPERKRVSINIDDFGGITKGTYYCYEDKVNYLADLQNQIRIKQSSADLCSAGASNEGTKCSNENCSSLMTDTFDPNAFSECSLKCYNDAAAKCNHGELGDLRRKLHSEVRQYCP